jgi:uncharacterized damage-inducible protein DinB
MTEPSNTVATIYDGWHTYQSLLITAIAPLSAEQLTLSTAPGLRTVGDIVRHIIGARGRWFNGLMGEGGPAMADLGTWDRTGSPSRTAADLVQGLEVTWQIMHEAIARWNPEEWATTYPGEPPDEPEILTRAWVIWHLIEHDLHHGGEVSLTLGTHGLAAPGL